MQESSKLADQIKAQSNYKIREFEWFEVETKIRLFVQKLMEPTLRQIHEDRRIVDELASNYKQNNKEVTYLRDIVLNQGAGIPIFEEIKKQFMELEMKLDLQKRENICEFSEVKHQIDKSNNEISKFLTIVNGLEYSKIKLEQDLCDMQTRNDSFKQSVEQIIKQLASDLTESTKSWKLQAVQIEQQFQKQDNKHQDLVGVVKTEQTKLKQIQDQIFEINKKQQQNMTTFEQIDTHLLKQDLAVGTLKKQILEVDSLSNQSKQIQMFLVYYLPLYVQTQISDSLFTCLPVRLFYKLTQYEKQKFDQLDKSILEYNGEVEIQTLINQYSQLLENVTKRNSKINSMIVQNSHSSDSDVSEMKEEVGTQKKRESVQARKQSVNTRKGSQKIHQNQSQSNSLVYHEEQLKALSETLNEQFAELKQYCMILGKQVNDAQKDLDNQQIVFQNEIQNKFQRQLTCLSSQVKTMEENVKKMLTLDVQQKEDTQMDQVKQFRKTIQTVLHFLVLITHLLIQDEIDRQGIHLMGTRDTQIDDGLVYTGQSKKGASIQLNGECLSCSGQPIQLLNCFKIACLAYNPSDIVVDGKQFKRDQLLEMCTTLLRQAKQEFLETDSSTPQSQQQQSAATRQRSSSIPISPGRLSSSFKFKARKLAPMTNLHQ